MTVPYPELPGNKNGPLSGEPFLFFQVKGLSKLSQRRPHSAMRQSYWKVKRQLFEILCELNDVRKTAGKERLPYRIVHSTANRCKLMSFPICDGNDVRP